MSERFDPYQGHRPVGYTVSPEAAGPDRALEEVMDRADEIVADQERGPMNLAEEAADRMWAGVDRPGDLGGSVSPGREVSLGVGERRRSWPRILARGVGAVAAFGAVWSVASYLHESRVERAEEWIKRGENPELYCEGLGGTLHTIHASGVTADGTHYIADIDTPWGLYGQQGSFRRDVNELGLGGNDAKVQVCEVGKIGDGRRQELSVVPDAQDVAILKGYVTVHG